jgi:hypothetical protein
MSIFNNKGELNASSRQEALAQLAKIASILEDNSPSNSHLAGSPVNGNAVDELIARAIDTQDGKMALAQAMASPINL